jgi:tetratricopeptide (TPR) repeat protein
MHEKALLELTKGSPSTALPLAERAVNAETLQTKTGSRLNLVSRIQLLLGHRNEAENSAQRALAANQSGGQAEEESNSLRLLGIIARDRGAFAESVTLLEQALAIDKGLGISGKIALDLEELASTSRMAGRLQESKEYLERASVVNRAAGRTESNRSSKERIQTPQPPRKNNGPENNQVSGKESETIRPSSKP